MKIEEAVQNIDGLIANSRLTRQEHIMLQGSLKFLEMRAKDADELEKQIKEKT